MSDKINPEHYKRLPAEAIEIIESAIQNAPTCQDAYLQGQALKYLLRCWHKEGITDVKKAKWYIDRLIEFYDKSLADIKQGTLKAQQSDLEQPQLPDGWRWLEVGETLRRGDTTNTIDEIPGNWIGTKCSVKHVALRRNRFEVGEKVVRVSNDVIYKVIRILSMGYQLESEFCAEVILYGKDLAPYIEETT